MKRVVGGSFFLVVFFSCCTVLAQHRKNSSHQAQGGPLLLEALSQRTLPGARGSQPYTTYKFLIVWKSTVPPETFFWRPDGERWMTCAVTRTHHMEKAHKNAIQNPGYETEIIRLEDIHRGDTLELVPMSGGRDIMPASQKKRAAKCIYYKTAAGSWQLINVNKEQHLPDLIMS